MSGYRRFAIFLIVLGIVLAVASGYRGFGYYLLPTAEKFHHPLHNELKPSGFWGHAFGFIGTFIILLNFLYSLRKRYDFGERLGDLRYWLEFHMFVGFVGPILIIYHSTLKFQGIIATVSFFSMSIVVLSGIIGRYIYGKVPHRLNGTLMTLSELDKLNQELTQKLREQLQDAETLLKKCDRLAAVEDFEQKRGLRLLVTVVWHDFLDLKTRLSGREHFPLEGVDPKAAKELRKLLRRKITLTRRLALYDVLRRLLATWSFVHRKLAWVMFITLTVHVVVTVLLGFRWIF